MFTPFQSLPDHTRIWIYQSNRKFNQLEKDIISNELLTFTNQWSAHGTPLSASFDIRFNQFVILAVDEHSTVASGCSIDNSVRTIKELGQKLNVDFFDRTLVSFRSQDKVFAIPVRELKKTYQEGFWNSQSLVINNLISSKGDLNSDWLVPAGLTWLKRYIPSETIAG